ncbi:MAG: glycerol-3-phosphate 1-O-acyltransferase PlsY [Myxococcales bacterium]|nr:glycerol-3-phosphate 1-O-acyltransferase PlsY [Myxococcales bacterium]
MTPPLVLGVLLAVTAFLSGSVPYGAIFARRRGVDIQAEGSGNIGATNVARTLGKGWGAAVLLLDAAKGAAPVAVAWWQASRLPAWAFAAAGLLAVVGHCYTPWLRFRGGKGVATALGVFLVLDPLATLVSVALFALVYAATKKSSAGSLTGALAMPVTLWIRGRGALELGLAVAVVLVIFLRHRDNLRRLAEGKEHGV